jgi:AcrR family transcriptional regulator
MSRSVQLPAPGRGAYDRSLSRVERDQQHRERLLLATAEAIEEGPLTVARIIERAGVGRSTFYEFFDSPENLLEQLEQRMQRHAEAAVEAALAEARTPLERVRAITRHFMAELEARPVEARAALTRRNARDLLSPLAKPLHRALERVVEGARNDALGWFRATDDATVLAAAAAVEALARRHLSGDPIRDGPKVMSDLVIKLLR